jgi:1-hydroxycarotenoid 3,4-desaturase
MGKVDQFLDASLSNALSRDDQIEAPVGLSNHSRRSSSQRRTVVVGAGIGGLVAALQVANLGDEVIVLERASQAGGKVRQLHGVDSGPTVFTMRWILDQVFESCGERLEDHLQMLPLNNLARHAWAPGAYGLNNKATLDLFADRQASIDAIGQFSGLAQAKQFAAFCAEAKTVYQTLEAPYIRSQKPGFLKMTRDLGPSGLMTLSKLGPFASLWQTLGRHFTDPRLRQLFGRYATYCGASPWLAPATLMLIAQVEMDGVWAVNGGMRSIVVALQKLCVARGVQFHFDADVNEIKVKDGAVSAVRFTSAGLSNEIALDHLVFNGDVSALASGQLGQAAQLAVNSLSSEQRLSRRSLSAVTLSFKTNKAATGFPLVRHNVFFDQAYDREFNDVFNKHRLPENGTVYVCAQDRSDDAVAQEEQERVLCLINAPAIGDQAKASEVFSNSEVERCIHQHFKRMELSGLQLSIDPSQYAVTTPIQFNQLFPGTGGALYGQASHGWMNQFQRMGARSHIAGLYLAGGSVHPGPGVPMAAMSGQLAAAMLKADRVSTSLSKRAATVGGTSMR